jgi:hypothetical protein
MVIPQKKSGGGPVSFANTQAETIGSAPIEKEKETENANEKDKGFSIFDTMTNFLVKKSGT